MYNTQEIAERIRITNKNKNQSLGVMLSELKMGVNTISELSKGKQISYLSFAKIADYLEVSVDYLLGRTDNPNTTSTTISNSNFNSGNISGDNIQAVNTDENISKRDRQLLKQINSLDFQDYCKVMAYIGELIKK